MFQNSKTLGGISMTSRSSTNSFATIVAVGFMLFALFFGAGNLIFPVMLGQLAGENVVPAIIGFIITGVGLPILGVFALAFSGKEDVQALGSRVHPTYGLFFSIALYLAIGPMFAIPRTATVSYEIGIVPFLNNPDSYLPLFIFSIIFFGVTLYFSLLKSRLVDIVGKILTPLLLIFIAVLIAAVFIDPIGAIQPATDAYKANSFSKGFQEGYLTMDALAAFVFGIIIVNIVKENGAKTKKEVMTTSFKIALLAGALLTFIYASLAYLGATSVEGLGILDNGGAVLASVSQHYFGYNGNILLALIVLGACLTTSIGLISSCASYFHKLVPAISYNKWAVIFSAVSTIIANFGLATVIEVSVPVLSLLYPLAICLLVLTFLHPLFKGKKEVYRMSILFTFIVSLVHNLGAFGIEVKGLQTVLGNVIPWYSIGLGWIIPALIGGILGFIVSDRKEKEYVTSPAK